MIRCGLIELFLPGAGYALAGELRWAAASLTAIFVLLAGCLFTPWLVWAVALLRVGTMIDAGRRGRRGAPARGWQWKVMLLLAAVSLGMSLVVRTYALEAFAIPSVSMAPTLLLDDKMNVDKLSIRWRGPERGEVVALWVGDRTFVKRVIGLGGDRILVRNGILFVNGAQVPRRPLGPTSYRDRDEMTRHERRVETFVYEERYGGRTYRVFGDPPDRPYTEPSGHDYPDPDLGALGCGARPHDAGIGSIAPAPGHDGTCIVPPDTVFLMGDNRTNSNDSRYWGAMPVDRVFGRVIGIWLGGEGQRFARIGAVE